MMSWILRAIAGSSVWKEKLERAIGLLLPCGNDEAVTCYITIA